MRQAFKNHHLGREYPFGRHASVQTWIDKWKGFDPTA